MVITEKKLLSLIDYKEKNKKRGRSTRPLRLQKLHPGRKILVIPVCRISTELVFQKINIEMQKYKLQYTSAYQRLATY